MNSQIAPNASTKVPRRVPIFRRALSFALQRQKNNLNDMRSHVYRGSHTRSVVFFFVVAKTTGDACDTIAEKKVHSQCFVSDRHSNDQFLGWLLLICNILFEREETKSVRQLLPGWNPNRHFTVELLKLQDKKVSSNVWSSARPSNNKVVRSIY